MRQVYTENIKEQDQLSLLSKDIIKTLLYFDIFKYPVTTQEIQMNSSLENVKEGEIEIELSDLLRKGLIKTEEEFYFLSKERENIVERRKKGNIKAQKYIEISRKVARFISVFPFVKAVFLSGSVSKGYADKNSDIDYFIITEPGRLWLSRTLLILVKKIFLFNSKKYFCLNYFIDSNHLEIPDRNLFTAKEINYVIPVFNSGMYRKFIEANSWTKDYFPNLKKHYIDVAPERKISLKLVVEKIFSGIVGEFLDTLFMKLTERFWKYKHRKKYYGEKASIRCKKHVSKFHPHNFEHKTLTFYQARIRVYEEHYKVSLQS